MLSQEIHDIISDYTCKDVKNMIIDYAEIKLEDFKEFFKFEDYFKKDYSDIVLYALPCPGGSSKYYPLPSFARYLDDRQKNHFFVHLAYDDCDYIQITNCKFQLKYFGMKYRSCSLCYTFFQHWIKISKEEHPKIIQFLWDAFPTMFNKIKNCP